MSRLFSFLFFCLIIVFFSSSFVFSRGNQISKCVFYDKRNKDLKQVFYVPTNDVNMYKETIRKLLSREISLLEEPLNENSDSHNMSNKKNVSNFEEIKKNDENNNRKRKEMEEKLKYIEKYRNYAKCVLKNVEFKCENVDDLKSKVKCNLCVYTEIVNNKHIRQGQIIQIFMNECMYGFYYYDNINQYTQNNEYNNKSLKDYNSTQKLDDIYFNITKDISEGNVNGINFFKQQSSKYHPVCYVTE